MATNITLFSFNVLDVLDRRYYNSFSLVLDTFARTHKTPTSTLLAILYSKLYIFINCMD